SDAKKAWDDIWTNRWDKEEFEQYLENERQRRELVQQLNDEFYREIILIVEIEYQLLLELEEAIEIDINDEYLIDSPKWSDDELKFDSDYKSYDPGYAYNFHQDHNKCW
ncbi:1123_t:CDS:1, partial [Racocetra persica]